MDREVIQKMLTKVLEQVDHDIAKDYNVETAEEPEMAERNMEELIDIVEGVLEEEGY